MCRREISGTEKEIPMLGFAKRTMIEHAKNTEVGISDRSGV
jgi:hypothetical protein